MHISHKWHITLEMIEITHSDMPYLDNMEAILNLAAILDLRKLIKSSYWLSQ